MKKKPIASANRERPVNAAINISRLFVIRLNKKILPFILFEISVSTSPWNCKDLLENKRRQERVGIDRESATIANQPSFLLTFETSVISRRIKTIKGGLIPFQSN